MSFVFSKGSTFASSQYPYFFSVEVENDGIKKTTEYKVFFRSSDPLVFFFCFFLSIEKAFLSIENQPFIKNNVLEMKIGIPSIENNVVRQPHVLEIQKELYRQEALDLQAHASFFSPSWIRIKPIKYPPNAQ